MKKNRTHGMDKMQRHSVLKKWYIQQPLNLQGFNPKGSDRMAYLAYCWSTSRLRQSAGIPNTGHSRNTDLTICVIPK
jgi:hypothetical protein